MNVHTSEIPIITQNETQNTDNIFKIEFIAKCNWGKYYCLNWFRKWFEKQVDASIRTYRYMFKQNSDYTCWIDVECDLKMKLKLTYVHNFKK